MVRAVHMKPSSGIVILEDRFYDEKLGVTREGGMMEVLVEY